MATTPRRSIALATLLRRQGREVVPDGRLYVEQSGTSGGSLGDAALDERAYALASETLKGGAARTVVIDETHELLVEPIVAKPHLVVVGAGHVGLALARLAHGLAYDVRHLLLSPPTRPIEDLPAHHPYHRIRRTVDGRTHLSWMEL